MLISVVVLILISYATYKAFSHQNDHWEEQENNSDYKSYTEIKETIENVSDLKERIDELNNIIADLESCAPGKIHKIVQISIPEKNHQIELMTDGEDFRADLFLEILTEEREALASSLRKELSKIR